MIRIIALLSLWLFLSNLSYATHRIVQNTADSGSGSFREAVEGALDGDTVRFNPNLIASGSASIILKNHVRLKKGIVIIGLYNATDTLYLSGNDSCRILYVTLDSALNKTLTLDSLVMTFGNAQIEGGGAVSVWWATEVNLFNSRLYHNRSNGGALYARTAGLLTMNIRNSTLDSNRSPYGGAICMTGSDMSCVLNMENSAINNNRADEYGGGIYCSVNDSSKLNLTNSSFIGNSSYFSGGGIYANTYHFKNEINLVNSVIENNQIGSGSGAGIYCNSKSSFSTISSSVAIKNSFIRKNQGAQFGAAVYCYSTLESFVSILNSTISENSTMIGINCYGGGLYNYSYARSSRTVVENSSISNNTAGEGAGIYSYSSSNSSSYPSSITINNSTISSNTASSISGGGIYSEATTYSASDISITNSTVVNNKSQYYGSAIYSKGRSFSKITIRNSTFAGHSEIFPHESIYNSSTSSASVETKGSIFLHGLKNISNTKGSTNVPINSLGYNIFNTITSGSVGLDQVITNQNLVNLAPLSNNGGPTQTMLPNPGSIAIDQGDSSDHTPAQNGKFSGIRDIGAAESCISAVELKLSACEQYLYKGNLYFENETFIDSFQTVNGCDSIVTTYLVINYPNENTMTITSCDTFIVGNKIYTSSGQYVDTLVNAFGCDSVVNTNLTIIKSASSFQSITACGSYFLNGNTYSASQIVIDKLVGAAANGCDSIVTTNLTINKTVTTIKQTGDTLVSDEIDASYRWLDCETSYQFIPNATGKTYAPIKRGFYAVEISKNNCVDTSSCIYFIGTSINSSRHKTIPVLYPNPSNSTFSVSFDLAQTDILVEIYSQTGRIVYSEFLPGQHTDIHIDSNIKSGNYLVKILNNQGESYVLKFQVLDVE